MTYEEADFLQLSGLQHFAFCRRQWALIHVEQLWEDNYLTVDGSLMHEKAHDINANETRGDKLVLRGVYVHSTELGVSGQCDVLEFHRTPKGVLLNGREGKWMPFPVEYKRGIAKINDADRLQLCAQAMCLEEMLCCHVDSGALYYGRVRRREEVCFNVEMRANVVAMLREMHELFKRGYTPVVKKHKGCASCSVKDLCMPGLPQRGSVMSYLRAGVEDEACDGC